MRNLFFGRDLIIDLKMKNNEELKLKFNVWNFDYLHKIFNELN